MGLEVVVERKLSMGFISAATVRTNTSLNLQTEHEGDYGSVRTIAACLRRAAAAACPCSPGELVRLVTTAARGLITNNELYKERVEDTLEKLLSYGDFLEEKSESECFGGRNGRLLYNVPPSFVARNSGGVLLLGIAPDMTDPLPADLMSRVQHVNHTRTLTPAPGQELIHILRGAGLIEIPFWRWLWEPTIEEPWSHVASWDIQLQRTTNPGNLAELFILDPGTPSNYYRGRWKPKLKQSGRFIGRRPQTYGSPIWCYVELEKGVPIHLLDFPQNAHHLPGRDDAWRLQMAIDARNDNHQTMRALSANGSGIAALTLFSPIPTWMQHRWDMVGIPVERQGCLLSYDFPPAEVTQEVEFATRALWLRLIE